MATKAIKKINKKNTKKDIIELGKEVPATVLSVQRQFSINFQIIGPKELDELYALVPEVSRSIDLRGSAIIYRGYEITPRDDSQEAKDFANICAFILNVSGGTNFIEQWQKNADLYGNGYVELVEDGGKVVELAHVHSYNFGYELEVFQDPVDFVWKTKIKLDPETQKPVAYSTYKFDEEKQIAVSDKIIPIESIAHLKYKLIGDALYGISIVQPMQTSVVRKLKLEKNIEDAGRLVAAPKIVIQGEFATDEEAKEQAREAANLDVNDVVILQNGKDFKFVNPGPTQLTEFREIFVTNITTASGIPRPILTSEASEINKATMQELMRQLRENMRSNMHKMKNIMEQKIFMKIGESYGINNYNRLIPVFSFPEDPDTEEEVIVREEKKAATLTSLSNSLMLMNNMLLGSKSTPANTAMATEIEASMKGLFATLDETMKTFNVNNDQDFTKVEEELPGDEDINQSSELSLDDKSIENSEMIEEPIEIVEEPIGNLIDGEVDVINTMTNITLIDDIDTIRQPEMLLDRHRLLHMLYEYVNNGAEIYDIESGLLISTASLIQKHMQYLDLMKEIGMVHEPNELGQELDTIIN